MTLECQGGFPLSEKIIAFSIKILHNKIGIQSENIGRGKWIGRINSTGFISSADNTKSTFAGQNDLKNIIWATDFYVSFGETYTDRSQITENQLKKINYKIATNYILGFDENVVIAKHNFRQADALEYAKNGTLEDLKTKEWNFYLLIIFWDCVCRREEDLEGKGLYG